jgi:hypothetical protein
MDKSKLGRICKNCGQDHYAVAMCLAAKGGRHKKDPEKCRAAANVRWNKYRADKQQETKNVYTNQEDKQ